MDDRIAAREQDTPAPDVSPDVYEPPRIETVLTAEDLAREIQYAGTTSVVLVSDRLTKEAFAPVDAQAILAQVAQLPIETWNYRDQDPSVRHIGPMAQDFAALFTVGEDDRHIHTVDGIGVALAAIQGLAQRLAVQETELQTLRAELRRAREDAFSRPW